MICIKILYLWIITKCTPMTEISTFSIFFVFTNSDVSLIRKTSYSFTNHILLL